MDNGSIGTRHELAVNASETMKQQLPQVSTGRPVLGKGFSPAGSPGATPGSASFGLVDIAYIFYRHKAKILVCSTVGIAAAAAIAFKYQPDYLSDSKLMIRYVVDSRRGNPLDTADQVRNPDSRGDNIINSEVELIMSLDVATEVARQVGPTNILKGLVKPEDEGNLQLAGLNVRNRLDVRVKPKSNVIGVSFQHPDLKVARQVLERLIGSEPTVPGEYLKTHARVHRAVGLLKDLQDQAVKSKGLLSEAQRKLKAKKDVLKIVSVPEAKKSFTDQLAKLRTEKWEAEANLAEARASYQQITNSLALAKAEAKAEALAAAPPTIPAPEVAKPTTAQESTPAPVVIPPEVQAAFDGVNLRMDVLRQREQVLLLSFLPTSPYVKRVSDQIAELSRERLKLIQETPALTNAPVAAARVPALDRQAYGQQLQQPQQQVQQQQTFVPRTNLDPLAEAAKVDALAAKVKVLGEQLKEVETAALNFAQDEPEITQLERDIVNYDKQYSYYSSATDEASVDESVYSSRMSNISVLQYASPPYRATGVLLKLLGGAAFGGIGVGVGLALLIEFITDRSVRRPKQVTDKLHVPLFLSVPKLDLPQGGVASPAGESPGGGDAEELNKFAEALRDRLIMHFQVKDVTHKPKLIGVTSCGRGAGVTTLATSLAASLSETGEGNVLYVDVNQQMKASAHPFRKGKPAVGLSEALGQGSRESAQVSENLFMVSLGDPNSGKVGVLPKKLANLVPEIRKSNYDYIIFDLPPVTQTSVAARVSGLMDTTVMVLEAEKTQEELARQAVRLLEESNTELVAVLNKHKRYLPQGLESDL